MRDHFNVLSGNPNPTTTQDVHHEPRGKPIVLRFLCEAPQVDVEVEIDPADALPVTALTFVQLALQQRSIHPPPLRPHPWRTQIAGGYYSVLFEVNDPDNRFVSGQVGPKLLLPPLQIFKRRVTP